MVASFAHPVKEFILAEKAIRSHYECSEQVLGIEEHHQQAS
jgi:hypothetical protein